MRNDHCWSHGRGRPSASFHAGSWMARAHAFADSVTPRVSSTMRGTLLLRLSLCQSERVDLHPVAEAAQLLVVDPVALSTDPAPERGEGAHLAGLLDEAHPRVDEEADAADHRRQLCLRHLARVAHRVDDADGGGQGVGELLERCGARLLEVVAADVDRVPPGHVADRVGDQVDGEAATRSRGEDVGPAAQVLLDDVVLRGALEKRGIDALVLGVGHVEGEQPRGRGVDGHRGIHLGDPDTPHQLLHVPEVGHRDADLAHLAGGLGGVGVVAGLRGQVERNGQAGLALGQVGPVELVEARAFEWPE